MKMTAAWRPRTIPPAFTVAGQKQKHPGGVSLRGARLVRLVQPAWGAALPASSRDLAAFLAAGRDQGLAGNTLETAGGGGALSAPRRQPPLPTDTAEISETMAGIRRDAPNPAKKRAATLAVLRELLAPIPDDLRGRRDRALLLVGFAGALRRSELAGILNRDLVRTDQGFELTLHRSKGAQTDAVLVPLPYGRTELCPVRALTAWRDAAAITDGPVFRRLFLPPHRSPTAPLPCPSSAPHALTPRSIARIVQPRAAAAGFAQRDFGGHSLKRGALTSGMAAGAHPAQLNGSAVTRASTSSASISNTAILFDTHPLKELL